MSVMVSLRRVARRRLAAVVLAALTAAALMPVPPAAAQTPADGETVGLVLSTDTLDIAEGDTAAYTVALQSKPADDVVVSIASADPGAAGVFPVVLTLSPSNWNDPRSVTVYAVSDDDVHSGHVAITHSLSSDDGRYHGIEVDSLTVSVTDRSVLSDATLSSLALTAAGPRGINFRSATTEYSLNVHHSVSSTTLTATPAHDEAKMTAGRRGTTQRRIAGDVESHAISLRYGDNPIDIVVTARDGSQQTYSVTVTRERKGEDPPRNLRLIPDEGRLTLTWDHADPTVAPSDSPIDGYRIRWSVPKSGYFDNPLAEGGELHLSNQPTEYTISGLDTGTEYAVHIRAARNNKWVKVFGTPGVLPPPKGLTLVPGDEDLTLSWGAPSGSVAPFHAVRWRAGPSGAWLNPATSSIAALSANGVLIPPGTTSYRITGLTNGTPYEVQLKARPDSGHGEQAGAASAVGGAWATASGSPAADAQTYAITTAASVSEGDDIALTVSLSRPAPAVGVTFRVSLDFTGSAHHDDVGHAPLTVTVPRGARRATFKIPIIDSPANERSETFGVTVAATQAGWSAASATADSATVTIIGTIAIGDVVVEPTSLAIAEGDSAEYTIVLTRAPTDDVKLTLSSANPSAVAVDPASLTFSSDTWREAQTVTVSALRDGNETSENVAISQQAASDDLAYQSLELDTVAVTVTDAGAGIALEPGSLTVIEGESAEYTVALKSQPDDDVVVSIAANDPEVASVTPSLLTFASAEWHTPQTVRVVGTEDADEDSESVSIVHSSASTGTSSYSHTANVTVTVTDRADLPADAGLSSLEVSALPEGFEFDSGTPVYVRTVHNSVDSTSVTATVRDRQASISAGLRGETASALDSGVAGDPMALTVGANIIDIVVTAQNGAKQTYTVNVERERREQAGPRNVRLLADSGQLTVLWDNAHPTSDANRYLIRWRVTGTTGNWLDPGNGRGARGQDGEFVISGLENGTSYDVHIKPSGSTRWVRISGRPGPLPSPSGVTVTPGDSELTLSWAPSDDRPYYAVRWRRSAPSLSQWLNFRVNSIAGNSDNGKLIEPGATSFTTPTARNLLFSLINGAEYEVQVKARSSSGDAERPSSTSTNGSDWVSVTAAPAAGAKMFSIAGVTAREGTDARLAVTLGAAAPAGGVTFSLTADFSGTASAGDAGSVPASVTVAAGKRQAAVTIPIVRDGETDDDEAFTVTAAGTAGWTAASAGADTATVTIVDDSTAAPEVSFRGATAEVAEAAREVIVTAQIAGADRGAADVKLEVADAEATHGDDYLGPQTIFLFFPPRPNGDARTVGVTIPIPDDGFIEGDETFTVAITGVSAGHIVGSQDTLVVTIVDDDGADVKVTPTTLRVEEGSTDTYSVALSAAPSSDVTVKIASADDAIATAEPTSLTFDSSNWHMAQDVSVTGTSDENARTDSTSITHAVESDDQNFAGITPPGVPVTVLDADRRSFEVTSTPSAVEGETATVTVTLNSPAPWSGLLFDVRNQSTAASADDVGSIPPSARVEKGDWSVSFDIDLLDDAVDEDDEELLVVVSTSATGWKKRAVGTDTATVTIIDNDTAGLSVFDYNSGTALNISEPIVVTEGTIFYYSMSLDTEPASPVTLTRSSSKTAAALARDSRSINHYRKKHFDVAFEHDADARDETVTVTHQLASIDGKYNGLTKDIVFHGDR